MKTRNTHRIHRHKRLRSKIHGTATRPRLAVFRSNKGLYVQLIDDVAGKTIVGVNASEKTVASAKTLGEKVAKLAVEKKISEVVFDRGGYMYHGSVKAIADGARLGGLKL